VGGKRAELRRGVLRGMCERITKRQNTGALFALFHMKLLSYLIHFLLVLLFNFHFT
jgi:hypothetical protein